MACGKSQLAARNLREAFHFPASRICGKCGTVGMASCCRWVPPNPDNRQPGLPSLAPSHLLPPGSILNVTYICIRTNNMNYELGASKIEGGDMPYAKRFLQALSLRDTSFRGKTKLPTNHVTFRAKSFIYFTTLPSGALVD